MKVLFLFFTDPPRAFSSSVAALSGAVRAAGHAPVALEIARKSAIAETAERVEAVGAEVLAISAMSRDWPGARALLERLGSRAGYVVVGGYHATLASDDVASCRHVDAICIGEGERSLPALLDRLASGEPPDAVPGIWTRGANGFERPVPGAWPEPDIATLPPWDYDVFGDVRAILRDGINTFGPHVDGSLPTRAGRGCPFACGYCSAPRWGQVAGFTSRAMRNTRPVDPLCDELARLRDRYGPQGFEFWDEHFPIDLDWLRELASKYPGRVGLPFKVEMHPNAATRERLELLVEAGCVLLHCGVEAGDEDLRRNVLNRRTRDERLEQLFEDARALGLRTSASVMTSLPGETPAQAIATVDLLRRLRPGSFMWSTYQELPGTVLGEAAVHEWPGPSRERFDDYAKIQSRTPSLLSDADRSDTFRALGELQTELASLPSGEASQGARARPVEIPVNQGRATPELARLLGLRPPGSPLSGGVRVNMAVWDGRSVSIELEGEDLPPHRIDIGPLDGSPRYASTSRLGLAYRGREAPTSLLQALDALVDRLDGLELDALRRALSSR